MCFTVTERGLLFSTFGNVCQRYNNVLTVLYVLYSVVSITIRTLFVTFDNKIVINEIKMTILSALKLSYELY